MKLSTETISVLKNYSSINQNLKIGASNNLVMPYYGYYK